MWKNGIKAWPGALRVAGALVLMEQGLEALLLGTSLAEHPALVIAALGALGAPLPKATEEAPKAAAK